MLSLIDETGSGDIYDLGSGWGNLVIRLARKFPERQVVGYELSFFPWLFAKVMKNILNLNNLALYREDFMTSDLTEASVITCYLFPKTMQKVEAKLQCQINDGKGKLNFVVSNNFALPSYQATKTIRLNDFYKSPVYLYRM